MLFLAKNYQSTFGSGAFLSLVGELTLGVLCWTLECDPRCPEQWQCVRSVGKWKKQLFYYFFKYMCSHYYILHECKKVKFYFLFLWAKEHLGEQGLKLKITSTNKNTCFLFRGVNLEEDSSSTFPTAPLSSVLFLPSNPITTLVSISRKGVNCLLNAASQFIDWS